MKKLGFIFLICISFSACQSSNQLSNDDIYEFLQECFNSYYDEFNIKITPELNKFELFMIKENQLKDTTGSAYKKLFKKLDETTYFPESHQKKIYNKVILLKTPSNIITCATHVYAIDSQRIKALPFARLQSEMQPHLTENDAISLHYFFKTYAYDIKLEEYRKPYIKQTLLLFLYRWYYQSQQHWLQIAQDSTITSS